jgi:hypothetical protein
VTVGTAAPLARLIPAARPVPVGIAAFVPR